MANIDKRNIIDRTRLSGENYFTTLLKQACVSGILTENNLKKVQIQCVEFLAYKCERYNSGDSSSIRVEIAESIMKSNLYTIGIFLKSLSDDDSAALQLKTQTISDMYQKGRRIIDTKFKVTKHIYLMMRSNKIDNPNYTYNATIGGSGIGIFFKTYNIDFEAHESPASIDYQICNPIDNLVGVEFIQKYTENLLYENQFCRYFDSATIHHLLCGFDDKYEDLLINIFEQVLATALGCIIVGQDPISLNITREDICILRSKLNISVNELAKTVRLAYNSLVNQLDIKRSSLKKYIEMSLSQVTINISNAVKLDTLPTVFPSLKNMDLLPKIRFFRQEKMENNEYCKIIEELLSCRLTSDKLALIKEKIHTFGDLDDVLFDVEFSIAEVQMIFNMLDEVDSAALIKRHPIKTDVMAEELSETELNLCSCLQKHMEQLNYDKRKRILEIVSRLVEE